MTDTKTKRRLSVRWLAEIVVWLVLMTLLLLDIFGVFGNAPKDRVHVLQWTTTLAIIWAALRQMPKMWVTKGARR